jgi:threonine dehydratase
VSTGETAPVQASRDGVAVTASHIEAAAAALRPHLRHTPVIEVPGSEIGLDATLVLKLEYLQHSGSFKGRGATHFVATQPIAPSGIVAASGGNHGAAVAWAARLFGHDAHIFVPTTATPAKVDKLRQFGEYVSQLIQNYTDVLGRERVIAATDCGFRWRVHPQIAWAKLEALVEGAQLASKVLWR